MENRNERVQTDPGPTNMEIHEQICKMKISTTPHPSNIILRGGNVFPLVWRTETGENELNTDDKSK